MTISMEVLDGNCKCYRICMGACLEVSNQKHVLNSRTVNEALRTSLGEANSIYWGKAQRELWRGSAIKLKDYNTTLIP